MLVFNLIIISFAYLILLEEENTSTEELCASRARARKSKEADDKKTTHVAEPFDPFFSPSVDVFFHVVQPLVRETHPRRYHSITRKSSSSPSDCIHVIVNAFDVRHDVIVNRCVVIGVSRFLRVNARNEEQGSDERAREAILEHGVFLSVRVF
jgi:hypothetical protein